MKLKLQLMTGIALTGLMANMAMAQTATTPATAPNSEAKVEEIVVTGIRGSLKASLDVKRNAVQIVDAVSALDVGKFPDANIADSLQRITGVSIDRSGGEGQTITVRGLGPEFNTVLVNGRVMATENQGREFSFDVLSSSIISRTEVFKSSVPNLQEGGIGATVNITTAKPFDRAGTHISASAAGIYDTLASKIGPDLSGVFSTTNSDKTIGFLASVSYSDRKSQEDYVDINGWIPGDQGTIAGTATSTGLQGLLEDGKTINPAVFTTATGINTPRNLNFNREKEDRKRLTATAVLQGKVGDNLVLTVDGLYSKFDVKTTKNFFAGFFTPRFIDLKSNSNGTVTGFNRPGSDFLTANPGLTDPALAGERVTLSQNDNVVTSNNRLTKSYQIGFNAKWTPLNNLKIEFDYSHSKAQRIAINPFVVVGSLATTAPRFDLVAGQTLPSFSNLGNITDPATQRLHFASVSDIEYRDTIDEFRGQGEYKFDADFLKSVQFGVDYSKRKKANTVSNTGSEAYCAYCGYNVSVNPSLISPYALNDYLSGVSGSSGVPKNFFTFDPVAVLQYESLASTLNTPGRQSFPDAAAAAADTARLLALPNANGAYGIYTPRSRPGESLSVTEKVISGFINTSLGGDFGALPWSGNIGARIVSTKTKSVGFGSSITSVNVNKGDDNLNIVLSAPVPVSVSNSYTDILPSANLKLDVASDMVVRFAISRTVTRPTLASLGTDNSYGGRITNATSTGGNPNLTPFKAWNFDATYEWYINKSTFVGVSGFYKRFSNFLERQTLPVVVPGVDAFGAPTTYTFADTRTRNGQTGSIAGIELSGQHSFDELPGIWSGLGVGANYTYVTSKAKRAATASALNNACSYEGLSPHSFNVNGFYEKGPVQFRLAYNWRAAYLLSCYGQTSVPESRRAYGQADLSASYAITDNFQVYVEGVNLLNSKFYNYSVLTERFLRYDETGSRYSFGVRVKF